MKKTMWYTAAVLGAGLMVFALLGERFSAFAITFGTAFYHFAMRLFVGYAYLLIRRPLDAQSGWFAQKKWEKRLYDVLRVKRWKDRMPTYNPGDFSLQTHTPEQIVQTMCVSELVHETIMLLSFAPLAMIPRHGAAAVFWITSVLAAAFDGCFVVMQRYNRPRIIRLMERQTAGR